MLGTCAECGLEFSWPEVLHPEKFEPQWCVEFMPRGRSFLLACVNTFLRSFWPWGFWSRLQMSQPIRPKRLVFYVMLLIVPLLVLYAAAQTSAAIYVRNRIQQGFTQNWANLPRQIQMQQAQIDLLKVQREQLGIWTDASQQREAQRMQRNLANLQSLLTTSPPPIGMSYAEAIIEAVASPLSTASSATVTYTWGVVSYCPPSELYEFILDQGPYGWTGSQPFLELAIEAAFWFGAGVAILLILPASFTLLPASRRKAKVRWAHIGRVTAYRAFIPVSIFFLWGALLGLGMVSGRVGDLSQRWLLQSSRAGIPLMLLLWWGAAINRYLKIRHGLFAAAALLVLCGLIVMTVVWFISPQVLIEGSL